MFQMFDHLVLLVEDIESTSIDFAKLGFMVSTRADVASPSPTENRLICFDDGSYIEIMAFRDRASAGNHRLVPLLSKGDGWADYSILSDDLDNERQKLIACGISVAAPTSYGKDLQDGSHWQVDLLHLGSAVGFPALPFLARDLTPHHIRVPNTAIVHPNGARAVIGITVVTSDLARVIAAYEAMLDAKPQPIHVNGVSGTAVRFTFGRHWIEIIMPDEAPSPYRDFVRDRGEGLYSAVLLGAGDGKSVELDRRLAHGARLVIT